MLCSGEDASDNARHLRYDITRVSECPVSSLTSSLPKMARSVVFLPLGTKMLPN